MIDDPEVVIGNTIRMECKVDTVENNEVIFRWFKGDIRRLLKGGRINITNDPRRHLSILEIKNSVLSDAGTYTCKVHGSKSDSREQMILVVGE